MHAYTIRQPLQSLDLTGNDLKDADAHHIAEAIMDNRTSQELHLGGNKFTDVGVMAIARALPHMQGLKKLSLWGLLGKSIWRGWSL